MYENLSTFTHAGTRIKLSDFSYSIGTSKGFE